MVGRTSHYTTKTCPKACLSANADFADTKKKFQYTENGMTELRKYLKPFKDKNDQLVTGGIFYCRDSRYLSVSASKNFRVT